MDAADIQKRIDDMVPRMVAKGLRAPEAELVLSSQAEPSLWLKWVKRESKNDWDKEYQAVRASSIPAILDDADKEIAAMPNAKEMKLRDFVSALGNVIDLGRENGIEVSYVNPLIETMKRLSENAITHQKIAAE